MRLLARVGRLRRGVDSPSLAAPRVEEDNCAVPAVRIRHTDQHEVWIARERSIDHHRPEVCALRSSVGSALRRGQTDSTGESWSVVASQSRAGARRRDEREGKRNHGESADVAETAAYEHDPLPCPEGPCRRTRAASLECKDYRSTTG